MGYYTNLVAVIVVVAILFLFWSGGNVSPVEVGLEYGGENSFLLHVVNSSGRDINPGVSVVVKSGSEVVFEDGDVELTDLKEDPLLVIPAGAQVSGKFSIPSLSAGDYVLELSFSDKYAYKQVYGFVSVGFTSEGVRAPVEGD